MAMRRVAGDEDAADAILVGDSDAQVPEPDMVEFALELEPCDAVEQAEEIVILARGAGRHGRVKEKTLADIDAAEELPIAFEFGPQHQIGRAVGKTLQPLVQLARSKHRQHHKLVEIGAAACNADLLAHDRTGAV